MENKVRFWLKHYGGSPHVIVYTHGSRMTARGGNEGYRAGAGIFFGLGNDLNQAMTFKGRQTRDVAQLVAVIVALRSVRENSSFRHVEVRLNSHYVVEVACLTGDEVDSLDPDSEPNVDLIRILHKELDEFDDVRFAQINKDTGGEPFAEARRLSFGAVDKEVAASRRCAVAVAVAAAVAAAAAEGTGAGAGEEDQASVAVESE